jgi:23S rRNA G2445 N2-methylase RlmL
MPGPRYKGPITIAVQASRSSGGAYLNNSHFTELVVKDAIVDVMRRLTGKRPDVDLQNPFAVFHVHLHRGQCWLYR